MDKAREQGRVCNIPHDPSLPVHTAWDMGKDGTAIIFFQLPRGGAIHCINEYHDKDGDMPKHVRVIRDFETRFEYTYGEHIGPWEVISHDYATGDTREKMARDLGIRFKAAPKMSRDEGISAVQAVFPQLLFDRTNCGYLVDALASYQRKRNKQTREWLADPVHNWASHPADALRYLVIGRSRKTRNVSDRWDRYTSRPKAQRLNTTWMAA